MLYFQKFLVSDMTAENKYLIVNFKFLTFLNQKKNCILQRKTSLPLGNIDIVFTIEWLLLIKVYFIKNFTALAYM